MGAGSAVLALLEVAGEVEQAAAEVLAAGEGVDPADDVLPSVLGLVGQAEHGLEVRCGHRPDLEQPRADLLSCSLARVMIPS